MIQYSPKKSINETYYWKKKVSIFVFVCLRTTSHSPSKNPGYAHVVILIISLFLTLLIINLNVALDSSCSSTRNFVRACLHYYFRQGGGMFYPAFVCLFVCLSVCLSVSNFTWKPLMGYSIKFYKRCTRLWTRKNWLTFGSHRRIRMWTQEF